MIRVYEFFYLEDHHMVKQFLVAGFSLEDAYTMGAGVGWRGPMWIPEFLCLQASHSLPSSPSQEEGGESTILCAGVPQRRKRSH
jgi:hypothetical protein